MTVDLSCNDELVEWLHEHAELIDDPFACGHIRRAADEIERLTGIVLCLMRRWPDCNATNCGQPCAPAAIRNPNQGRGVDLDRTEGEGAPRSVADAGIDGSHDGSDGRVGHDHAGAASEPKPATDGDRASDPPGATIVDLLAALEESVRLAKEARARRAVEGGA